MDTTVDKFRLGISGRAGRYGVVTLEDTLSVWCGDEEVACRTVPGLGSFVMQAKELTLGWGQFPDGMEVIYLYDRGDDNFGYAVNLQDERCSEWGYAPFR